LTPESGDTESKFKKVFVTLNISVRIINSIDVVDNKIQDIYIRQITLAFI